MIEKKLQQIVKSPSGLMASGFGIGLVPYIPGTVGTVLGVPVVLLVQPFSIPVQGSLYLLMFVVGCKICSNYAKELQEDDPNVIVWDEIVGYCFSLLFLPVTPVILLAAFVLFRLFDILKPWPISVVQRKVKGGFGIMLDDVIAGIATNFSLHVLLYLNLLM